jgi:preprotein translocase subunit SecA
MREVERRVMLSVLDRKWREHLYEMDYLQEGIGLRAMAQRDPLVEYQREGFQLWEAMNESVKEEAVGLIFHVDVQVDQPAPEVAAAPQHVSAMFGGLAGGDADAGAGVGAGSDGTQEPEVETPHVEVAGVGVERPRQPAQLHYTAPSESGEVVERDVASPNGSGAGRGGRGGLSAEQLATTPKNAQCPCGSGKKFKMCHGAKA